MASLLAALRPQWFLFVVSIAGFVSPSTEGVFAAQKGQDFPPLLQLSGKADDTVSEEHARKLCEMFPRSEFISYDAGHRPPTAGQKDVMDAVVRFIQQHGGQGHA
uniref:Serine hydrolase domain-containing protein n=1 Tax=Lotharella oceanica TaxID=641309 RepID=A0A7S2XGS8_9EUKA|mmetsp:Transcript_624/g.1168  ORF Transcript_624/g.1168 Transcript_624/m.1168 type:complete len:105 (+) Transcript_624:94-408(+)|eukprot:CAMPEP_0170181992 /NCGR_PEP_ID=MMETSP0040_2-20121228/26620_1 /TAXON_ID=641309 /ORGANISM="Lotharella oceanica, Strain CCMP622" /LENGTH=104 /DNA_ID=CAMNT_0010427239 /DNA_START=90 /DNA_END=404 /DNA_ORIENTATION=-